MRDIIPTLLLMSTVVRAHCKFYHLILAIKTISIHSGISHTLGMLDRFSKLVLNGVPEPAEWTSVRTTKNWQDPTPDYFDDVTSTDMRCDQLPDHSNEGFATIQAGSDVGFVSHPYAIFHDGPVQFYMARVPQRSQLTTWEPEGPVWFKIGYMGHQVDSRGIVWPAMS